MKNEVKTGLLVVAGIALFIFGYSYLKSNDLFVSDRTFMLCMMMLKVLLMVLQLQ